MRLPRGKLFIVLLIVAGGFGLASLFILTRAQQTGAEPGTLDWYAEQAVEQGSGSWELGAGIFDYIEPKDWNDVLAWNSLVVVEPIEVKSYSQDDRGIWSWWRFRVVETLSQKDVASCNSCSIPTVLPSDFSPPQQDQIVVQKYSGWLLHNGVWLTAIEPSFPEYVMGQKYLLILELDPRDRSGEMVMGPLGVYRIDSSGLMTCVCEYAGRENPYRDILTSRYGNSLAQLRAELLGLPNPTPTPTPTPNSCQPSSILIQRCQDNGGYWDFETCRCT